MPWTLGVSGVLTGLVAVWVAERSAGAQGGSEERQRRVIAVAAASTALAVLFAIGRARFGGTVPVLLAWCWVCALGTILALVDLRCRRLPFTLLAAWAGGCLVCFLAAAATTGQWMNLLFAATSGLVVLVAALVAQGWAPEHTGGGDSALYGAIAVFVSWWGWAGLLRGLLWASVATAAVALAVAAVRRSRRARFPAGPSLIAGALASVLSA
ncbi:methyltransferase [Prauserella sp. PE36]|uniref:methyltransferase n=1 Tax=Prauserella sp. PE36 TaxID=1504709 RepID=UPI001F2C435B|nr:methyltransferase [Prauserella sp. PE36]